MQHKWTWLACTMVLALAVAPAILAQNTWVVSDDDDDSKMTLFGSDDSAFLGDWPCDIAQAFDTVWTTCCNQDHA